MNNSKQIIFINSLYHYIFLLLNNNHVNDFYLYHVSQYYNLFSTWYLPSIFIPPSLHWSLFISTCPLSSSIITIYPRIIVPSSHPGTIIIKLLSISQQICIPYTLSSLIFTNIQYSGSFYSAPPPFPPITHTQSTLHMQCTTAHMPFTYAFIPPSIKKVFIYSPRIHALGMFKGLYTNSSPGIGTHYYTVSSSWEECSAFWNAAEATHTVQFFVPPGTHSWLGGQWCGRDLNSNLLIALGGTRTVDPRVRKRVP